MRTRTIIAAAAIAFMLLTWNQAVAASRPVPDHIVKAAKREAPPRRGTVAKRAWIVCQIFPRCRPALNVAWCESSLRPWARNGQYLGLFQMGRSERSRFGHGRTAWDQARAARKYHRLSGWTPWSCKP